MRLLVPGATPATRFNYALRPDRLGVLLGPGRGFCRSMLSLGAPLAADNGCFTGLNIKAFLRLLSELVDVRGLLFVTSPDVVADARATLARLKVWGPTMRGIGLPTALVGQDGLTPASAPWDDFDSYFVGGSDGWRESSESYRLVAEAKARGMHVHFGRVNSLRRMRLAAAWGVDTIDGTGFTWFSDRRIPQAIRWMDDAVARASHPTLFLG